MRISTNDKDPSYWDWRELLASNEIFVFLDDVEQTKCTEADEDAGYIVRCVTDADGLLVTNGESIHTERIDGNVRIVLEPRA